MAYEHDVFLSYTNEFPFADWVHEHFLPFFKPFVANALNRNEKSLKVFVDRDGIASGDNWPARLQRALACSRCLVAIWSPNYFRSEWCRKECEFMLYREKQLGYRTVDNPGGLILPVNIFDGEHFPALAKKIQYLDCKKFCRVGTGFRKTELYIEFQEVMTKWSYEVANAIIKSPRWQKAWLTERWFHGGNNVLSQPDVINFPLPSIG